MKPIITNTRTALLITVTGLVLAASGTIYGQNEGTAKGGGQKLVQAQPLKTSQDIGAVKNGDIVTSTCAKCKTTSYKRIDTAKGGAAAGETGKGQCPACETKASTSGEMKHTCKMCQAETICCVIPAEQPVAQKKER